MICIQEKQGDVSDDETVAFKSYLLSLGIDDPVTRETHGSGQSYYRELAKEVCRVLEAPVRVSISQSQILILLVHLTEQTM